jgi:hypothetical protein
VFFEFTFLISGTGFYLFGVGPHFLSLLKQWRCEYKREIMVNIECEGRAPHSLYTQQWESSDQNKQGQGERDTIAALQWRVMRSLCRGGSIHLTT